MLVADVRGDVVHFLRVVDNLSVPCHHGDLFQNDCVMDRVKRVLAPGEGAMAAYEHRGNIIRVDFPDVYKRQA